MSSDPRGRNSMAFWIVLDYPVRHRMVTLSQRLDRLVRWVGNTSCPESSFSIPLAVSKASFNCERQANCDDTIIEYLTKEDLKRRLFHELTLASLLYQLKEILVINFNTRDFSPVSVINDPRTARTTHEIHILPTGRFNSSAGRRHAG